MNLTYKSLGLGLFLAAVGCGDQSAAFKERISLLDAPVALDDKLLFVDSGRSLGLLLDAHAKVPSPDAQRIALPIGPSHAERRLGMHDEALVLCDGKRASRTAQAEQAAVAVIKDNGDVRSYELGTTPFDSVVQSDDGRYAVLFRSGNEDDRVLSNANQLALVDLDKSPGKAGAVTAKTPTTSGYTPTAAVFSPTLRIGTEDRRLLVVLSETELTLIDLGHLERLETIVQLSRPGAPSFAPKQVLFGTDGEPTLYVRGDGSNDVFALRLEPRVAKPDQNDFRPTINQLGGGTAPRDMALFGDAQNPRLIVVAQGSAEAIVIDPRSSKAKNVALPIAPNHALLFKAASPKNPKPGNHALLYGDGSDAIVFLDLDDLESRSDPKLEVLSLAGIVQKAIPLLNEGTVILLQATNQADLRQVQTVSLLDLAHRSVVPITSNTQLDGAFFDEENKRLWVAPSGQARVGTLELETGTTDEVLLDADIALMVPMFTTEKIAIVHPSTLGYVTFLDAKHPARSTAHSVRGFLISDVLDRGAP